MEDAQSLDSSLSNSTNSSVYPFCYKINERRIKEKGVRINENKK
jgi:hypothetical protein